MPKPELQHKVMPFGEHLEDLRRRIILALVGIVPIFVVALVVGKRLLDFIIQPVLHSLHKAGLPEQMIQTSPLESFYAYFRIALVVTIAVGSPWIIYQLWLFVAPGLYQSEKRFAHLLAPMSIVLTLAGWTFMYMVLLPVMLVFFVTFSSGISEHTTPTAPLPPGVVLPTLPVLGADPPDPQPGQMWFNSELRQFRFAIAAVLPEQPAPDASASASAAAAPPDAKHPKVIVLGAAALVGAAISQQYRLSEWVSLFLQLMLAMSLAFQTPVVVLLLGWAGIVTPELLSKYRRHALFACVIAGAVVTPGGDPVSMGLLTAPLYLLFELGVLLLRIFPAKRVAGKDELSDAAEDADRESALADPPPIVRDDEGDREEPAGDDR